MDLLERLLEEHKELRRLAAELVEAMRAREDVPPPRPGQAPMARLTEVQRELSAGLREHEDVERRLIERAVEGGGEEGETLARAIRTDHASIHELFGVLNSLTRFPPSGDPYSLRFAARSFVFSLERHMDYEEKTVFPLMKRLLPPARLQAEAPAPAR